MNQNEKPPVSAEELATRAKEIRELREGIQVKLANLIKTIHDMRRSISE